MVKYEKVEFLIGTTIEEAVNKLLDYKKKGKLVCGNFNEHTLYSDTVTIDGAYKEITGKTKSEFDKEQQEMRDNLERQEKEHKKQIPKLSKVWMEKGREILTEDKWELWDKIVPVRLNDLYHGTELGHCLDIVKILNSNGTLEEAKNKIESQGHSATSFGLVCSMIKEFCNRGDEFVRYLK